jgi:hypothetical protein
MRRCVTPIAGRRTTASGAAPWFHRLRVPRSTTRPGGWRFQGWALTEVARREPEYLEWLRRHSSGVRYRREIDRVLSERTTARR